jgi:hypothetical protein
VSMRSTMPLYIRRDLSKCKYVRVEMQIKERHWYLPLFVAQCSQ